MIKKIFIFLLIITIYNVNILKSSQLPRLLGSERKFRTYLYNPNYVYRYIGHYTYQGFIEFGKDELVQTITIGDPTLWLYEYLGNRLFLKPIANNAETNMTVITNEKIYHFELTAKEARGIDDEDLIFVVKFIYPDNKENKNIMQFPKKPKSDIPELNNLSLYNFNYQMAGSPSISPIRVFDNGIFTYFEFKKDAAEIPAIFVVNASGYEGVVNFRSTKNYIIVETVAGQFALRSGDELLCVFNNQLLQDGKRIEIMNNKQSPIARDRNIKEKKDINIPVDNIDKKRQDFIDQMIKSAPSGNNIPSQEKVKDKNNPVNMRPDMMFNPMLGL